MPRFHFVIVDGVNVPAPVGTMCKTEDQAKLLALAIARQIAVDVGAKAARKVIVVAEDGALIHEAPVVET